MKQQLPAFVTILCTAELGMSGYFRAVDFDHDRKCDLSTQQLLDQYNLHKKDSFQSLMNGSDGLWTFTKDDADALINLRVTKKRSNPDSEHTNTLDVSIMKKLNVISAP